MFFRFLFFGRCRRLRLVEAGLGGLQDLQGLLQALRDLLDARGAISVTERAAYIGRIRNLARAVGKSYLDSRARLGFPMAPKAHADEVLAELAKAAEQATKKAA